MRTTSSTLHPTLWFCLAVAIGLQTAALAPAAVIFIKGQEEPIRAIIVKETALSIVIKKSLGAPEQTIRRDEIEDIVLAVSKDRLESLSPDSPQGYRDYAEELSEKRDPEARQAALRLFLIAAHLDPKELGRSCLLGMAGLAHNEKEQAKYRAMVYLLDPEHDRRWLERPDENSPGVTDRRAALSNLSRGLKALRQGYRTQAMGIIRKDSVQAVLTEYASVFSVQEFLAAADDRPDQGLPGDVLRRIVTVEVAVERAIYESESSTPATTDDEDSPWARVAATGDTEPVPSLSLLTITRFDPRECVYVDGNWQRPTE